MTETESQIGQSKEAKKCTDETPLSGTQENEDTSTSSKRRRLTECAYDFDNGDEEVSTEEWKEKTSSTRRALPRKRPSRSVDSSRESVSAEKGGTTLNPEVGKGESEVTEKTRTSGSKSSCTLPSAPLGIKESEHSSSVSRSGSETTGTSSTIACVEELSEKEDEDPETGLAGVRTETKKTVEKGSGERRSIRSPPSAPSALMHFFCISSQKYSLVFGLVYWTPYLPLAIPIDFAPTTAF
nr:hypothetical transcript [Hymenolepis microstoma]